jgi:hypothetical protein
MRRRKIDKASTAQRMAGNIVSCSCVTPISFSRHGHNLPGSTSQTESVHIRQDTSKRFVIGFELAENELPFFPVQ